MGKNTYKNGYHKESFLKLVCSSSKGAPFKEVHRYEEFNSSSFISIPEILKCGTKTVKGGSVKIWRVEEDGFLLQTLHVHEDRDGVLSIMKVEAPKLHPKYINLIPKEMAWRIFASRIMILVLV
jgi:hypothetical protein